MKGVRMQTALQTHHMFNCTHIHTTLSSLDLLTDPVGMLPLLTTWTDRMGGLQKSMEVGLPS